MLYRVIWGIDINAKSAKKAANKARLIQLDPDNQANFFSIRPRRAYGEQVVSADLHPRKETRS